MSTTIDSLFPSNFLKASDLKGQRRTVTIAKVTREKIGKNKELKPIVYFTNVKKGMVLNKTNAERIAFATGARDVAQWPGKKVTLFEDIVDTPQGMMPAIRVMAADDSAPTVDESNEDAFLTEDAEESAFGDDGREPGSDDGIDDRDNPFA